MSNLKYLEPATGQPVATDTVSGNFYQLMKVDIGALGSSVPWTGTVVLGAGAATIGTVNAVQSGTYNIGSVASITGVVSANNTQIGGVAVSTGQGVADTGTQRIALARQTPASTTDLSGTLATGGTAQQIAAANANRSSLIIQNTHATAVLRVNPFGVALTTGGLMLNPGIGYEWPFNAIPLGAISVNSTTAGATWYAREGTL